METSRTINIGSELEIKAKVLLAAAHEYWMEYRKQGGGAVVWLENDNGHFVLFTRSEYKESIMAAAYRDIRDEEIMFEPFAKGHE